MSETMLKKIFSNLGWNFMGNVTSIICGLLYTVSLTRYLSVSEYGQYSYVIAFTTLFSSIAVFGLENIFIVRVAKREDEEGELVGSAFFFLCLVDIAIYIICILASYILSNPDELEYTIIVATPILLQAFNVYIYWYKANLNSRKFTIVQAIIVVVITAVRLFGIARGYGLRYFFYITAIQYGVTYLAGWIPAKREICCKLKPKLYIIKELFFQALPLAASSVAIIVYSKIDQVMIRQICGTNVSGVYSIAVTMAEFWYFAPNIIAATMLPILSKSYKETDGNYINKLQFCTDILTLISYAAILGFWVFSKPVILLLYGELYLEAAPIMVLYIISALFKALGYARGMTCAITGKTSLTLKCTTLGAILNIVLNYFLMNMIGACGAAVATILSMAVSEWLGTYMDKSFHEIAKVQRKGIFPFTRIMKYMRYVNERFN